jgi:hypothetical protein
MTTVTAKSVPLVSAAGEMLVELEPPNRDGDVILHTMKISLEECLKLIYNTHPMKGKQEQKFMAGN